MKRFQCRCGNRIFFESVSCIGCGQDVGFDFVNLNFIPLTRLTANQWRDDPSAQSYRPCQNAIDYGACNWLVQPSSDNNLCFACEFNRIVPDLSSSENLHRWRKIEIAKKRLFYNLLSLNLPVVNRSKDPLFGLSFDFLEHRDSDQNRTEGFVKTGHEDGIITINILEADELHREYMRHAMNESYRTLLGHFRHEIGHYYWPILFQQRGFQEQFLTLFGDHTRPYDSALANYYQKGPAVDWAQNYISQYASCHPLEDWAESWAHYLHMWDTLETAMAYNVVETVSMDHFDQCIENWLELTTVVNELNRSMGLADAYPFVINPNVQEKLAFIHQAVSHSRANDQGPAVR